MAIRDIALGTGKKPHSRNFNISTAALTELYVSFLPPFNTDGLVKIFIAVTDSACGGKENEGFSNPIRMLNVISIGKKISLEKYFHLDNVEKSRFQLELVHSACLRLCEEMKWNKSFFESAYEQCLRANLSNAWIMKIGKRFFVSPSRQLTACLVCQWTVEKFLVDVVIISKKTNYSQLTRIINNDSSMSESFEKAEWRDNETFCITPTLSNKQLCIVFNSDYA